MSFTGRCYCGSLRFEFDAEPAFNGQCHCLECQYAGPQMAIYMCDAQPFHVVPDGVATFDKAPG